LYGAYILRKLELCGRVCYKSEERISDDSAATFVRNIMKNGHESVLEHVSFSIRFIVDRGVSHELVRHRLASFSQESTRYCNYGNDNECTFIRPVFWGNTSKDSILHTNDQFCYERWVKEMQNVEDTYLHMVNNLGATPQEARSVLPNSIKTEVIMTCNLREWRHVLKLRTSKAAHPQMREVMIPLLETLQEQIPVVFDDIVVVRYYD